METSTPKTPLERVEDEIATFINTADKSLEELADAVFEITVQNAELARPVINLVLNKLGMGITSKITEMISHRKNRTPNKELAVQREAQFDTLNVLKR